MLRTRWSGFLAFGVFIILRFDALIY